MTEYETFENHLNGENPDLRLENPGASHLNDRISKFASPGTRVAIDLPDLGEVPLSDVTFTPGDQGHLVARVVEGISNHRRATYVALSLGVGLTALASVHMLRRSNR